MKQASKTPVDTGSKVAIGYRAFWRAGYIVVLLKGSDSPPAEKAFKWMLRLTNQIILAPKD